VGEKRNAYRLLVGKPPLGRPRRRWVDNIEIDLLEIGWGGVDRIGLAQDRDKWRSLGKLSSGYIIGGLSSSSQFHRVIARVLRADSPPTRGRRSIGSGGESSSMLTSVEGNAVQGRMLL
jgi:hypothetical protein